MEIDMNALGFTLIAIVLIAGISFGVSLWLRIHIHTRLLDDIRRGDMDDFNKRIDSRLTCQTLSPYARELLRFQAYAHEGDRTRMTEQFNQLMHMKLSDPIKASLLMDGFNAFLSQKDRKHCKRILDAMVPELVDEQRKQFCQKRFDKAFGQKALA
jgi:hypothetical protein